MRALFRTRFTSYITEYRTLGCFNPYPLGIAGSEQKKLPIIKQWKEFLVLGFLGIFSFSTLNYVGLKSISASHADMISAGIPIAILFFTPIFLKEKVKPKA